MNYPCTGCGICCKKVSQWVEAARNMPPQYVAQNPEIKEVADFPHPINTDGSCSQLNSDLTCKVYDTRPDICSIKKTWEKYHQSKHTEAEYYILAAATSNKLMKEEGVENMAVVINT